MKRDWDVVREVLLEVEALSEFERGDLWYGPGHEDIEIDNAKHHHALLLWKTGFLTGHDGSGFSGPRLQAPNLTWAGYDLLDTIRSKTVWERIKKKAADEGVELTFDAVKLIGKAVLGGMFGGAGGGSV